MQERKYCEEMLPLVSRTFALGISLLQEPLAMQVGVGYLICRITDTVEDTNRIASSTRVALLQRIAQELCTANRQNLLDEIKRVFPLESFEGPEYDLLHNIHQVMHVFDTFPQDVQEDISVCVLRMAQGMAQTVGREKDNRLEGLTDYEDFARYCYYVAGTVGELLTKLFRHDRPSIDEGTRTKLVEKEIDFGLGLQMTNILKGIFDDHARGVVFLPKTLLAEHDLTLQSLFDNPLQESCEKMVFSLIDYILPYMDRAIDYTLTIPEKETDIRLFCALPILFALRTLRLAKEFPQPLLKGEPLKIKRKEVKDLHSLAEKNIDDNDALRSLFAKERIF